MSKPARRGTALQHLGALLLAGSLAACMAPFTPPETHSDRFVREPIELSHQVAFIGPGTQLDQGNFEALASFLAEVDPDRQGAVSLRAAGPQAAARKAAVADSLAQLGVEASDGGAAPASAANAVTVTLQREVLLPTACLQDDQWPDQGLAPSGCTTGLTAVEMAEDQRDLIEGRSMGPASGAAAAAAIERYLDRRPEQPASGPGELPPAVPGGGAASASQPVSY